MKTEMYAYLARRDKRGVKFLGSFPYQTKVYPTKMSENDLLRLNMDGNTFSEIAKALSENKMQYELFLETADSLESLKSSLRKRGYSKIPSGQLSSFFKSSPINKELLVTKDSIMMERGSLVESTSKTSGRIFKFK